MVMHSSSAMAQAQPASTTPQNASVRQVGTVKTVSETGIKLTTDAGLEVTVSISETSRLVRTELGQKDLSSATPIKLTDIQAGDRVLVRGSSAPGGAIAASVVVAMKSSDIAKKQQMEREDWQKRGIGGPVKSVDITNSTVTISTGASGAGSLVTVRIAKNTVLRRYAAGSVRFDDAKLSTLDEIKPGDQLRARGTRNADGADFSAEEVVTGTFRNVAGTVMSIDAASGTMKLMDLATKKPVSVKITADSQMHKLPPMVAQRIAMRLKGTPGPGAQGGQGAGASNAAMHGAGPGNAPPGEGNHRSGPADVQQMLSAMPVTALTDLQKNDAVMMVTTLGSESAEPAVIMLLSGVEPILTASPNGNRAAMLLSPWNLGSGGEGEAQ
jgi:hypothetical protein